MAVSRQRNGRWHYQIKRKRVLAQPIYISFESKVEGDAYVAHLETLLDRGIVPQEFSPHTTENLKTIGAGIRNYLSDATPPKSDRSLLEVLISRLGTQQILKVDYTWVEQWVATMKRVDNLAPSTIRHYVGALARCFDYLVTKKVIVANPIRSLPTRYAIYSETDRAKLPKSIKPKRDIERDRRLASDEEERVRDILGRDKNDTDHGLNLPWHAALEFLFTLAIESAMRLSEMYTLERKQFDVAKQTAFLDKTKNGDKRQVPLTTVAIQAYQDYCQHVDKQSRGMAGFKFENKLLFPWWNGQRDEKEMKQTTWRLSRQFSRIFKAANVVDFRFHDLRHEATSRYFERTNLNDTAIAKITGHRSTRSLARYANLRGSALANQLW